MPVIDPTLAVEEDMNDKAERMWQDHFERESEKAEKYAGLLAVRLVGIGAGFQRVVEEAVGSSLTAGQWWAFDAVCRSHPSGLQVMEITEAAYRHVDGYRRVQEIIETGQGLLTRKTDPDDRRRKYVKATKLGLAHHKAIMEQIQQAAAGHLQKLTAEDVQHLWEIAEKLR